MQVPAYCPSFVGVHVVVNKDERAEMKNVITMDIVSPDMSDDEAEDVAEGIDMPVAVVVVPIPGISILTVSAF